MDKPSMEALNLSPKEIRRRLNKDHGIVREKLKQYGRMALLNVIGGKKQKPVMENLLQLRDTLLLEAGNDPFILANQNGRLSIHRTQKVLDKC